MFDSTLMDRVVNKYNITSIYDPCAGWGERMLYCYHNDIDYHGVDINTSLKNGYDNMMHDFNMIDQHILFEDSACYVPDFEADAVITCPPYGSLEKYSDAGAEQLSSEDFLKWWSQVVINAKYAGIKYFCFQINQAMKESMTAVVEHCGFKLIDELTFDFVKSGHFTRRNGLNKKREYESMLVFTQ